MIRGGQVNRGSESDDRHPKITVEEPSQWNISFHSGGTQSPSEMESDEEDEDDWITFLSRADTSESIMILEDGSVPTCENKSSGRNTKDESDARIKKSSAADHESVIGGIEVQFMYIQMEFCEKSTLRTAIDGGLYKDKVRVWRLFRELVEGLDHLHQQRMIHRDLKPVNIFLDSNDHVKIGDFGLATTNIITRTGSFVNEQLLESIDTRSGDNRSFLNYFGDGSMTGEVGTALYAAPELFANGRKTIYSQKVDIYSLGIIFFEMCYHPLLTAMERAKVLMSIRLKDIIMPADLNESDMPQQYHIIRWLLNHDPNKRPTSLELLQSDFFPPPQLEETELQEMVRHTLLNPQSKAYKYLVDSCFNQVVTPAEDYTFNMSLHPSNLGFLPPAHKYLLQEAVKEQIVTVFRRHGAICVPTPLLLPSSASHRSLGAKSNAVNGYRMSPPDPSQRNASYVRLMTRSGGIVSLPHDLRMSFARYVAWNGISHLKRYSVDRVYREKHPYGFHPRELYECAFDIVTPDSGIALETFF
ncbi:hypothetical protein J437_LFUL012208 [Ladona fulva]|uniref:Protein kinase domain-containing protein n=1 Tax=Ladona fulva TaxID=123851 RepID=A0A8K0P8Q3_LADFU|nr:hypothetical protein J437_LFUL012208 [Ladona fulva]